MNYNKTNMVRAAVSKGNWMTALRLAKDFRINVSAKQREEMSRAYECMMYPDFYRQLGTDIAGAVAKGIAVVEALYGSKKTAI